MLTPEPLVIVQARTGSSRLPNKMLLPFFGEKTILNVLIEQIKSVFNDSQIIVATSINPDDALIQQIASENDIKCFRGSEDDVLNRFFEATKPFATQIIARVCGDNPFLRASDLATLLEACKLRNADYCSYSFPNGTPAILSHCGLYAEALSVSALSELVEVATTAKHREHLTSYILDNPARFEIHYLPVHRKIGRMINLRLTVDSQDDFLLTQRIYKDLHDQHGPNFTIDEIISYVDDRRQLLTLMEKQILANKKTN